MPSKHPDSKQIVHTPSTGTKLSVVDCPKVVTRSVAQSQEKFRSNVGAILFLARCTLPCISYAVGRLGRFAGNSGEAHWKEMQHLIKYIKSVRNLGIRYTRPVDEDPTSVMDIDACLAMYDQDTPYFKAFTDSDFAGCPDTSRSTSGGIVTWMGAAISWMSAMQACVTLSTAESEMVAMCKAAQEIIWTRRFITELSGKKFPAATRVFCDNRASLSLVKNRVHHARTKHIKLRENFIREQAEAGIIEPTYVPTDENLADCFTKPIQRKVWDAHCRRITGMDPTYV